MSTFKELQQRVTAAKCKAQIYQHLIDHIEANFRPVAGANAKKVLLTDEKVPVPDEYFEQVVKELFTGLEFVTKEVDQILSMPIAPSTSPLAVPTGVAPVTITAPAPAPVPVVAAPEPKKSSTEAKS